MNFDAGEVRRDPEHRSGALGPVGRVHSSDFQNFGQLSLLRMQILRSILEAESVTGAQGSALHMETLASG